MKLVLVLVLLTACASSFAKSARTYYTDARLGVMRQNLAQADWAQAEAKAIIGRADRWVNVDDARLRLLVPPPTVPRAATINPLECPIHGQEVLKHGGRYAWKIDFDHPYKVVCPVGGESYPSNDFLAYLQSGMKDKALLQGEYVDDGWGYQKAPGDKYKYWFVAYYAHWAARNLLHPALRDLSQAYLLTNDPRYAHKCALLLWQLAQYYPDYAYEKQSNYGLEVDSGYLGRLLYHTWETWTVEISAPAYDAIFPALAGDAELQKVTGETAAQIAGDIEERLLRTMARDITDGSHRIQGNYGMHQQALLLVAAALKDVPGKPSSGEMVDWVLNNPTPATSYTDTAFYDMLVNLLHRDGIPFESPSYNCGWMSDLAGIADLLQDNGVDLWQDKRFQSLFYAPLDAVVGGWFTTPLGDSNNMFSGPLGLGAPYLQRAYARLRDPRLARAITQAQERLQRDLFEPSIAQALQADAAKLPEDVGITSSLLPGLGNLTLQAGGSGHRTGLSLYYGYYVGHIHFDALNVDFYAEGNPLTPDLGYPETADTHDPRRFGFLAHTVVHNTCMVDGKRQELGRGRLVSFRPGGFAQMAEVTDLAAYPGKVKDYRRTVFLIEADPDHAYYVDLFRVTGGQQHDLLVHGTEAAFDSSLPLSEPRAGTLAGPDVPYGQFYDDEALKEGHYGLSYYNYRGSAFQWLQNVQQATVNADAQTAPWVRWTLNRNPKASPYYEQKGVALREHIVPDEQTVFTCDGTPQRRAGFPDKLKWVVRRRTAAGGELTSAFAAVYEGYRDTPFITAVRRLPVEPASAGLAVEVDLGNRRQIVYSSTNPTQEVRLAGQWVVRGRGAVIEVNGAGQAQRAALLDGSLLEGPGCKLTGSGVRQVRVQAVDYATGTVTLDADALTSADEGQWLAVGNAVSGAEVRVSRVLDARRFSLGDQDLRTARGRVVKLADRTISSNALAYFAEPGMAVVNETGRVIGRLAGVSSVDFTLTAPVKDDDLPDRDGDGQRRFTVMALGPGDTLQLGGRSDWRRR